MDIVWHFLEIMWTLKIEYTQEIFIQLLLEMIAPL